MSQFQVDIYVDSSTYPARARKAVYDTVGGVWYFPKAYGTKAAQALAKRLNKEAEAHKEAKGCANNAWRWKGANANANNLPE